MSSEVETRAPRNFKHDGQPLPSPIGGRVGWGCRFSRQDAKMLRMGHPLCAPAYAGGALHVLLRRQEAPYMCSCAGRRSLTVLLRKQEAPYMCSCESRSLGHQGNAPTTGSLLAQGYKQSRSFRRRPESSETKNPTGHYQPPPSIINAHPLTPSRVGEGDISLRLRASA